MHPRILAVTLLRPRDALRIAFVSGFCYWRRGPNFYGDVFEAVNDYSTATM
jgi:hypothetical protein